MKPRQIKYLIANFGKELSPFIHAPNTHMYTPLLLATYSRNLAMVQLVQDISKHILWQFGDIVCARHSLKAYDSLIAEPAGQVSMLTFLVENQIHECITPFITQLLSDKWGCYAKHIYYIQLLVYLVDLSILQLVIQGGILFEMTLISATTVHLVLPYGYRCFIHVLPGRNNTLSYDHHGAAYSLLVVLAYLWHHSGLPDHREPDCELNHCIGHLSVGILGAAAIEGWIHLLLNLRGYRLAGVSIIMLEKMVFEDGLKFLIVFTCVLMGFSIGLFAQFANKTDEELDGTDAEGYNELGTVWIPTYRAGVYRADCALGVGGHRNVPHHYRGRQFCCVGSGGG